MNKSNKQFMHITAWFFLDILFLLLFIKSDTAFIMHHQYIILIFISMILRTIIEVISLAIKDTQKHKKFFSIFKYLIFFITVLCIVISIFFYKKEIIDDNNANKYIYQLPNMNEFTESKDDIIVTDGFSYNTIFTQKWICYLTGTPYNNKTNISGLKVEYIDFYNNFICSALLKKYSKQLSNTYDFQEKNDVYYYEDDLLNEKQIYIFKKSNDKIIFIEIFTDNDMDTNTIIDEVCNKLSLIFSSKAS